MDSMDSDGFHRKDTATSTTDDDDGDNDNCHQNDPIVCQLLDYNLPINGTSSPGNHSLAVTRFDCLLSFGPNRIQAFVEEKSGFMSQQSSLQLFHSDRYIRNYSPMLNNFVYVVNFNYHDGIDFIQLNDNGIEIYCTSFGLSGGTTVDGAEPKIQRKSNPYQHHRVEFLIRNRYSMERVISYVLRIVNFDLVTDAMLRFYLGPKNLHNIRTAARLKNQSVPIYFINSGNILNGNSDQVTMIMEHVDDNLCDNIRTESTMLKIIRIIREEYRQTLEVMQFELETCSGNEPNEVVHSHILKAYEDYHQNIITNSNNKRTLAMEQQQQLPEQQQKQQTETVATTPGIKSRIYNKIRSLVSSNKLDAGTNRVNNNNKNS